MTEKIQELEDKLFGNFLKKIYKSHLEVEKESKRIKEEVDSWGKPRQPDLSFLKKQP